MEVPVFFMANQEWHSQHRVIPRTISHTVAMSTGIAITRATDSHCASVGGGMSRATAAICHMNGSIARKVGPPFGPRLQLRRLPRPGASQSLCLYRDLCENMVCRLPVSSAEQLAGQLAT